jgi:hypothetical protein
MPVVVNEDDHPGERLPDAHFTAALSRSAGWGFFDYRRKGEGASDGYQNPPVDWGIRSDRKKAFFSRLAEVTGSPVGGAEYAATPEERWWKGNVHTHTLWSDGDDFPAEEAGARLHPGGASRRATEGGTLTADVAAEHAKLLRASISISGGFFDSIAYAAPRSPAARFQSNM